METFNTMQVFVAVVDEASISGAARKLGMPKSTVSRRIAQLEQRLGAQLLVRTTRALRTTDVGAMYYDRCMRVVAEVAEIERAVRHASDVPRGRLRITTPVYQGGSHVNACMTSFLGAYPEVTLEVVMTNRIVDMVEEGFDVAVRAGRLPDSSLIARQLTRTSDVVVASPAYLARAGTPSEAAQLRSHECLLRGGEGPQTRWPTRDGSMVPVRGRLMSNNLTLLREAAIEGLGLAWLPRLLVLDDLERGALVELLGDEMERPTGIYLVYPPGRQVSAKVRAFIDHAVAYFEARPLDGS